MQQNRWRVLGRLEERVRHVFVEHGAALGLGEARPEEEAVGVRLELADALLVLGEGRAHLDVADAGGLGFG